MGSLTFLVMRCNANEDAIERGHGLMIGGSALHANGRLESPENESRNSERDEEDIVRAQDRQRDLQGDQLSRKVLLQTDTEFISATSSFLVPMIPAPLDAVL